MGVGATVGGVGGTLIGGPVGGLIGTAIGSLAEGAYDWWQGDEQADQIAELEKNNKRPGFDIPQSEFDALDNAKALAKMTRFPGQGVIEGRLDRTTADQVAMLERFGIGGADMINGASRIYGMQQDKENELGVKAADFRLRNQATLRDELHNMAGWENKKWDWETGQPYESKQRAIAALKGAKLHNQEQAFKNIAGGITMGIAGLSDNFDWFNTGTQNNTGFGTGENYWEQTQDDTGAPEYGNDTANYTDKMLNSGMGFFNGSN